MSSLGKTNVPFCLTRANSGKTGLPGWCERLCYKRILSAEGKTISANSDRRITQEKVPADPVARIASGVILRHSAIIGSLFPRCTPADVTADVAPPKRKGMHTHSPEPSNACRNPCEPSSHGLRPGDAISDARRQRVGATRSCEGIVAAPATPGSSTSLASNPSDPGHRLETVQRPSGDDATSASLGRRPAPCPLHFPPPLGSFEHRA